MSLDTDSLTHLSISLYDACYDDSLWPQAAQALRACLNSMAATLVVRQGTDFQTVHSDCDADYSQRYWQDFSSDDPMLAGPASSQRIYCDQTVMARRRFQRSALYNDWLRPQDRHSVLLIKIADPGGDTAAIFSLNRGGSQPLYDADDLAACRQLEALLTHAVRHQARIAQLRMQVTADHADAGDPAAPLPALTPHALRTAGRPDAASRLQAYFGFSPREAELAQALLQGLSLREAALLRHVGLSTVRSQLASLLRKTDTSRQGQLIALLAQAMTE